MSLLQTMTQTSEQHCKLKEIHLPSFEVIATPCWIIPYFKLLIWNSSQGMRREVAEDKWQMRNKDKNVLFDLARDFIANYKCILLCSQWTCFFVPGKKAQRSSWSAELFSPAFPGLLSMDAGCPEVKEQQGMKYQHYLSAGLLHYWVLIP